MAFSRHSVNRDDLSVNKQDQAAVNQGDERNLMLKIDLWILPTLTVLYLCSFIDKTNIANAKVYGMASELQLKGNEFNTALVIFFVAFVTFDIPCTIVLRKIRPHIWLPTCMFFFGIISMCQGFVSEYGGLLAARYFLGITEACSFSGCFVVLSQWYKREEAQKRFTFFYASAQLAGAFAGLLASAIGTLHGKAGYSAWRWIFIIEGACTAFIALIMYFIVPDFPEQTRWLTPESKRIILERLRTDDVGPGGNNLDGQHTSISIRTIFDVLAKPKVLLGGIIYFVQLIPAYAYAYFAPTIIKSYTRGAIHTQLLSVAPWAVGWVASLVTATLSDYFQHRYLFATLPILCAIPGYAILLSVHHDSHTQYAAMFLISLGVWVALPVILCWTSMNVHGRMERAVALGWIIGFGNISGIPAVFLFLPAEAPKYTTGYGVCIACVILTMCMTTAYAALCWYENRGLRRRSIEEGVDAVKQQKVLSLI